MSNPWATTGLGSQGLAIYGGYIYCANINSNSISKISLTNPTGDNNPNWVIVPGSPIDLAIDDISDPLNPYIFCTNIGEGKISKINLIGSPVADNNWKTGLNFPFGLAIDGLYIYCTNGSNNVTNNGVIAKIRLDAPNGPNTNLNWATVTSFPIRLAIDSVNQYIYCSNGNRISKINLTGSPVTDNNWLTSGVSNPNGLVINAGFLYCGNSNLDTISKINLTGSPVASSWAVTGSFPTGLVIDSGYIYEANEGNNNIWKISLTTPCFNKGTKILCLNSVMEEEYIPIEDLKKGLLVKSYLHGYRKIDSIGSNKMINNPEHFNLSMYKMEKTIENGLTDDLIVTGGHSILVDDLGDYYAENEIKFKGKIPKIDDKIFLLSAVSKDFTQLTDTNEYTYYHLCLENNGNNDERFGIWANGILTETISKNQFTEIEQILHF
jgi:hypothetical protein